MYQQSQTMKPMMSLYRGSKNKQNKRKGMGVQVFENGFVYEGKFENDTATGNGKFIVPDGTFYKGMYNKNCIRKGKIQYFWGSRYEGTFDSIEYFSNGALHFLNGDCFYGEWLFGKLKSGKLICIDGKTKLLNEKNKKISHYDKDTGYGVILTYDSVNVYEGILQMTLYFIWIII